MEFPVQSEDFPSPSPNFPTWNFPSPNPKSEGTNSLELLLIPEILSLGCCWMLGVLEEFIQPGMHPGNVGMDKFRMFQEE